MKNSITTAALIAAASGAGFTAAFAQDAMDGDTNGDGMVSIAELKALYTDMPEETLTAGFEQVDIDRDGLLNDYEIALAREAGIFPHRD